MDKTIKVLIAIIVTVALSFPVVATSGRLSDGEEAHLIFMRSEEKLARDVYLKLDEMYPNQPVFLNIATKAEQTHTDTMRDTLLKFNVADPEPNADDMDLGNFESVYFKDYFTNKFTSLIDSADSLLNALYVGALIEELDMKDINECNEEIYDVFGFTDPCGLTVTDVRALKNTLGNLLAGSENHLCAFISQIGPMIFYDCYEAQYLGQDEVSGIIGAACPEFSEFICDPQP